MKDRKAICSMDIGFLLLAVFQSFAGSVSFASTSISAVAQMLGPIP